MPQPEPAPTVLCFFRWPEGHDRFTDEQLERLQQEHLDYQQWLREQGKVSAAGPFSAQPDESWRGLNVYRTSLDEARLLAAQDPSVRAGRLAVDVFEWWPGAR